MQHEYRMPSGGGGSGGGGSGGTSSQTRHQRGRDHQRRPLLRTSRRKETHHKACCSPCHAEKVNPSSQIATRPRESESSTTTTTTGGMGTCHPSICLPDPGASPKYTYFLEETSESNSRMPLSPEDAIRQYLALDQSSGWDDDSPFIFGHDSMEENSVLSGWSDKVLLSHMDKPPKKETETIHRNKASVARQYPNGIRSKIKSIVIHSAPRSKAKALLPSIEKSPTEASKPQTSDSSVVHPSRTWSSVSVSSASTVTTKSLERPVATPKSSPCHVRSRREPLCRRNNAPFPSEEGEYTMRQCTDASQTMNGHSTDYRPNDGTHRHDSKRNDGGRNHRTNPHSPQRVVRESKQVSVKTARKKRSRDRTKGSPTSVLYDFDAPSPEDPSHGRQPVNEWDTFGRNDMCRFDDGISVSTIPHAFPDRQQHPVPAPPAFPLSADHLDTDPSFIYDFDIDTFVGSSASLCLSEVTDPTMWSRHKRQTRHEDDSKRHSRSESMPLRHTDPFPKARPFEFGPCSTGEDVLHDIQRLERDFKQKGWSKEATALEHDDYSTERGYTDDCWNVPLEESTVCWPSFEPRDAFAANHGHDTEESDCYVVSDDFFASVAAIVIQTNVRVFLARQTSLKRYWAIIVIQATWRRYVFRYSWRLCRMAAIRIQSAFRGWWLRDTLLVDQYCAVQIQKIARGYRTRVYLQSGLLGMDGLVLRSGIDTISMDVIVRIQALFRGYIFRTRLICHSFAVTIQAQWLRYIAQRSYRKMRTSVILCQARIRRYLTQTQLQTRHAAATTLQAQWRTHIAVMDFIHALADILVVQSVVRRWITLRLVTPLMRMRRIGNTQCMVMYRKKKSLLVKGDRSQLEVKELLQAWKVSNGSLVAPSPRDGKGDVHSRRQRARRL